VTIVITAPIDGAALNIPNPSAPTCKISSAKMGKIAMTPPKRTEKRSREMAYKIILVLKTKKSLHQDSAK
jgi:hypothetical protein